MQCRPFACNLLATLLALLLLSSSSQAKIRAPIRYLALGDSYAAGDGAGPKRLWPADAACGRFSGAYTYQILNNTDPAFAIHWPHYENHACGGATTSTVLWKQSFALLHKDLITIQVGGNEVDFFPVLNECIQQWRPLSSCDRELTRARSLVQSAAFVERFYDMLGAIKRHAGDETLVFVLGYARSFDAETDQCNGVSFSLTNPANVLSNELRRDFNELVVMLNDVIRASAEAHGAVYVDIDAAFEGHRFCEPGVREPRPDNEDTWFFRETPQRHSAMADGFLRSNSEQEPVSMRHPFRRFADLMRSFHPTVNGHAAISERIVDVLKAQMSEGEL
ncbi:hypothetical protein PMZ80_008757 [Knufia obscura]|uniref:SGNH hydrolase-type esterase domain-containing protein n=2 Tax=Knufia TaxID=430999 RepID=A0AAN8I707_9EURO|nr:hypothetical protein PMZ80_008757 [Knufia obscura]KAK5955279.1 hypothetical protein OHC33_003961 [Knufia fluminis]